MALPRDGDVLLGLQSLVHAVGESSSRHEAAGELIDYHHLAVLDRIVDVALKQGVGLQA